MFLAFTCPHNDAIPPSMAFRGAYSSLEEAQRIAQQTLWDPDDDCEVFDVGSGQWYERSDGVWHKCAHRTG